TAHPLANLVCRLLPVQKDQPGRGADLARRAVAALEGVMVDEDPLQGVERLPLGEAFNRGDLGAVLHDRGSQARVDPSAIQEDRARATLPVVTSLLFPG